MRCRDDAALMPHGCRDDAAKYTFIIFQINVSTNANIEGRHMNRFVDAICNKVSWEYHASDFSIMNGWNHLTTNNTTVPVCFGTKECCIVFDMRENYSNGKIIFDRLRELKTMFAIVFVNNDIPNIYDEAKKETSCYVPSTTETLKPFFEQVNQDGETYLKATIFTVGQIYRDEGQFTHALLFPLASTLADYESVKNNHKNVFGWDIGGIFVPAREGVRIRCTETAPQIDYERGVYFWNINYYFLLYNYILTFIFANIYFNGNKH